MQRWTVAAVALLMVPALAAKQKHAFELEGILRGLEENLQRYDREIPSFFCDEHSVSEMTPGTRWDRKEADSIFRLEREPSADGSMSLAESREVKMVDGRPSSSAGWDAPATIEGAFEGGLAVVSMSQQACMEYQLEHEEHGQFVVSFRTRDENLKNDACLLHERARGRAVIDPASLQVTHLELTMPQHRVPNSGRSQWYSPTVKGEWVITVDYAPVILDGRSFWMPSSVRSRVTGEPNTFHSKTWTFQASYRNFHKLEVASRIVPQ